MGLTGLYSGKVFLELFQANLVDELLLIKVLVPKDIFLALLHHYFNRWCQMVCLYHLDHSWLLPFEKEVDVSFIEHVVDLWVLVPHEILEIFEFTAVFGVLLVVTYVGHYLFGDGPCVR